MTVYVDNMRLRATVGRLDRVWCHLMIGPEDEIAELHRFARLIGLKMAWFQGPPGHPWPRSHYDVTEGKRREAVAAGAVEISWREAGKMLVHARERRIARALELAMANGHGINVGEHQMECRRCLMMAIWPNMTYGLAAARPCPPPRPWHEMPDGPAAAGHGAAARALQSAR